MLAVLQRLDGHLGMVGIGNTNADRINIGVCDECLRRLVYLAAKLVGKHLRTVL